MCIAPNRRPAASSLGSRLQNQLVNHNKLEAAIAQTKNLAVPCTKAATPQRRKTSRSQRHHITVQHNYHDHSNDVCCEESTRRLPARGGVVTPFPLKLHSMLDRVSLDGLNHIISWQPHGRCFVVHDAKQFVAILEEHFKISKVSSFQRQLNLYGFQRLTKGQDKGGYYHELFLRGKVFLSQNIQRIKVKGTKIRARSNPDQEPNFYSMPWVMNTGAQKEEKVNYDYFTPPTVSSTVVSPPASVSSEEPPMHDALDALIDISPDLWEVFPQDTPLEEKVSSSFWDDDALSFSEDDAEVFLQDCDFPSDAGAFKNVEDDDVFGDLLEQIIAS